MIFSGKSINRNDGWSGNIASHDTAAGCCQFFARRRRISSIAPKASASNGAVPGVGTFDTMAPMTSLPQVSPYAGGAGAGVAETVAVIGLARTGNGRNGNCQQ
ncbi:hypothetical protein [Massilia psychrophila]|uniref:hypothetical protein n=1 Tax=Massilia psychrophila TaxID=1603353 RepID=UPI0015D51D81|nr:hypothetical protein [Massilia psychrophila]